jgi:hypothetical protein
MWRVWCGRGLVELTCRLALPLVLLELAWACPEMPLLLPAHHMGLSDVAGGGC